MVDGSGTAVMSEEWRLLVCGFSVEFGSGFGFAGFVSSDGDSVVFLRIPPGNGAKVRGGPVFRVEDTPGSGVIVRRCVEGTPLNGSTVTMKDLSLSGYPGTRRNGQRKTWCFL